MIRIRRPAEMAFNKIFWTRINFAVPKSWNDYTRCVSRWSHKVKLLEPQNVTVWSELGEQKVSFAVGPQAIDDVFHSYYFKTDNSSKPAG
ncbi:Uncharacterized protein HZ326_22235 [Fusarium oxysporum f. sp. albedinis]|nr:Uncharacterized protein HZ326_22235 [Fusarium oxysporum f. sp. albedinis]